MTARKLGRLPNDPRKPRVRLARVPGATLTPPTSVDWVSGVSSWNMALNDDIGDCTAAGAGHIVTQVEHYGRSASVTVPDSATLAMYEAISGYNPNDPSTDVGATLQDALAYWQKTGIAGYKIAAYAQIDHADLTLVRNCIDLFGSVYTGFNCPQSAISQFNAGKPWTVVRSSIAGGHCVPIMAYDGSSFTAVTWGNTQKMDLAFFQRYFDEVWVAVDTDWLETNGKTPSGLDGATANADYQALTGDSTAPFPTAPAPVTPPPADVDTVFAEACHTWLAARNL